MLRTAFYRLLLDPGIGPQMSQFPNEFNLTKHLEHCFDYIRQGIMCAADPTIESVHHHAEDVAQDNGWGNTHICRSWDALKAFTESKRATDFSGLSLDHYFDQLQHGHERFSGRGWKIGRVSSYNNKMEWDGKIAKPLFFPLFFTFSTSKVSFNFYRLGLIIRSCWRAPLLCLP